MVKVSFDIDDDLLDKLTDLAEKNDRTIASQIRILVKEAVK